MVIHADKLRWLFWLRWKMFTRSLTRDKGRIVGLIFLILFGLPFMGTIAFGTFVAYRFLPADLGSELLFIMLTGIYLFWIMLPLLEFTVNEGLDLSKLALFPLTRAELMASLLLSTLLDVPTVGLLLVLGGVVAGWFTSLPLGLLALLTMLVFYVQLVGISQLVLALFMRTLQSRRFRDLSIIIFVLLSSSGYLCQFAFRGFFTRDFANTLQSGVFSSYLQWLPPGMAARAIQQAVQGHWGMSFAWLGVLALLSVLVLYLWQLAVERGLSSAESGGAIRVRQQRSQLQASTRAGAEEVARPGIWGHVLALQVRTIALKELKYFRRDPQLQATFLSSLMSVVFLAVITVFNMGNGGRSAFLGEWSVVLAPAFVFLSLYSLSYNSLGLERQGLTTLFLFPINPRYILWGKNLVVFLVGIVEVSVLIAIAAFLSQAWHLVLPALTVGLSGILVVLGCGNFTSVLLPQRMRQIRRGFQTSTNMSTEGGCLRAVMSFVALAVMGLVLLPVILALILPVIFQAQWIWAISLPASLIYGAAFYYVVTALVAQRMVDRIPEILNVVARE